MDYKTFRKKFSESNSVGLTVKLSNADGHYQAVLTKPGSSKVSGRDSEPRRFVISTDGVEVFRSNADRFSRLDFEHSTLDQAQLLDLLIRLATGYLDGEGEVLQKRSLFGRRRSQLILMDGSSSFGFADDSSSRAFSIFTTES